MAFSAEKFLDMVRELGKEGMNARLALDAVLNEGAADETDVQEGFAQLSILNESYFE